MPRDSLPDDPLAAQRLGVPLYELLGIDPSTMPVTSFTIGMDTPEAVEQKVHEAEGFAVLKVKMGSDDDAAVLETVRRLTDRPIRIEIDGAAGSAVATARIVKPIAAATGTNWSKPPIRQTRSPIRRFASSRSTSPPMAGGVKVSMASGPMSAMVSNSGIIPPQV